MKNWRDLLYFSKGERNALTFLLCLIAAALILLLLNDTKEEPLPEAKTQYIVNPDNAPVPVSADTTTLRPSRPSKPLRTAAPSRGSAYARAEKFSTGTFVELNTADTTNLKKVPGIGSTFARRIVKYRDLLGGFYAVSQLREVYGIDDERYGALHRWFYIDTAFVAKLPVNRLSYETLIKHPYIDYKQAKVIMRLLKQKGCLTGWENLRLLDEFTAADRERLRHYLSFE